MNIQLIEILLLEDTTPLWVNMSGRWKMMIELFLPHGLSWIGPHPSTLSPKHADYVWKKNGISCIPQKMQLSTKGVKFGLLVDIGSRASSTNNFLGANFSFRYVITYFCCNFVSVLCKLLMNEPIGLLFLVRWKQLCKLCQQIREGKKLENFPADLYSSYWNQFSCNFHLFF